MKEYNINELIKKAIEGTLPSDFDQWHLLDNTGRTVAHQAVRYN
jgi:hypothetical protein